MNVFVCLLVVCLAVVSADVYGGHGGFHGGHYGYGFRKVPGGFAAPYRNDNRQHAVNHVAEHVGAGTGTARYYGVPGTGKNFDYRGGYHGGAGFHGGRRGGYGSGFFGRH